MARLDIRPVTCANSEQGWSHAIILSEQGTIHADGTTPTWIIAISIHDQNAKEIGPRLLDQVNQHYQQSELKTPEVVYQILKHLQQSVQANIDIAAIVLLPHQMTLYGFGNYAVELCRQHKCGTIISGVNRPTWQVVEGKWEIDDRWWIVAGSNKPNDLLISAQTIEQIAEQLQSELITQPNLLSANILVKLDDEVSPSINVDNLQNVDSTNTLQQKLKSKKHIMIVGWVILLLLVISIWFGSQARIEQRYTSAYKTLETQVTQGIAAAEVKKTTDQITARQEFRTVQTAVTNTQKTFENNPKWAAKWKVLNDQVTAEYQSLAGETALNEIAEWYSLSIINPSIQGNRLVSNQDSVFVLDNAASSVIRINTTSKKGETIIGSNAISTPKDIAVSSTKAYTLSPTGITETIISKKTSTSAITAESEWLNPERITTFNGNIYVYDSTAQTIWRYPVTATGFGQKQTWLGTGVTIASDQINSMAIDGDLWLLKQGSVQRFRRGAPMSFSITGMDIPLSSNTPGFAVATDQDKIAVIDSGNQRIVIVNKKGEYQKQIQWSGLSNAKDIALSADGTMIYILANGKIYQIVTP